MDRTEGRFDDDAMYRWTKWTAEDGTVVYDGPAPFNVHDVPAIDVPTMLAGGYRIENSALEERYPA